MDEFSDFRFCPSCKRMFDSRPDRLALFVRAGVMVMWILGIVLALRGRYDLAFWVLLFPGFYGVMSAIVKLLEGEWR